MGTKDGVDFFSSHPIEHQMRDGMKERLHNLSPMVDLYDTDMIRVRTYCIICIENLYHNDYLHLYVSHSVQQET